MASAGQCTQEANGFAVNCCVVVIAPSLVEQMLLRDSAPHCQGVQLLHFLVTPSHLLHTASIHKHIALHVGGLSASAIGPHRAPGNLCLIHRRQPAESWIRLYGMDAGQDSAGFQAIVRLCQHTVQFNKSRPCAPHHQGSRNPARLANLGQDRGGFQRPRRLRKSLATLLSEYNYAIRLRLYVRDAGIAIKIIAI